MKNKYTFFDGEIVSHNRNGILRDYVRDPQGSFRGTLTPFHLLGVHRHYWPFGEVRSSSGDANNYTPFQFLGPVAGYYADTNTNTATRLYIRARHLQVSIARWLTQDPLWPQEPAYRYVNGNPTTYIDPSGMSKIVGIGDVATITGKCCRETISMNYMAAPHGGVIPIRTTRMCLNTHCAQIGNALSKCKVSVIRFCEIFEPNVGGQDCCSIAAKYNVSGRCFCALIAAEHSNRSFRNTMQDTPASITGKTLGDTVGCAQLSVGTAQNVLKKLKKCDPGLHKSLNAPVGEGSLRRKLASDCTFSMEVLAAFVKVNTDPKCTKQPKSCATWAKTNSSAGYATGNENHKKVKCMVDAFSKLTPCS